MTFQANSEEETIALGARLAAMLPRRAVVLLSGNLGAGKTTLSKGLIEGLGAGQADEVSSPTFTLIHEFSGDRKVYHIDLYRLEDEREVLTLGLDDLFEEEAITIIEWGERFPRLMPRDAWRILLLDEGQDRRRIEVTTPQDHS